MALPRVKHIKRITIVTEDGTKETWDFPNGTRAIYRERNNGTTESDPVKEEWHEHDIFWTSDRRRPVKSARTPGPEVNLAEKTKEGTST